jgi:hypothetical protein
MTKKFDQFDLNQILILSEFPLKNFNTFYVKPIKTEARQITHRIQNAESELIAKGLKLNPYEVRQLWSISSLGS